MTDICIKHVYEPASPEDGVRILVDRLWPRGFTKEKLKADLWLKEIAPSHELRNWYHRDLSKMEEFRQRYFAELDANPKAVELLREKAKQGRVTLLYAARDSEHNHAVVLKDYLLGVID
jgi:uncharacterized protein YeaO (DUF488 family)